MAITERIELYKKIEEKRGNPLIVYITSQRTLVIPQMRKPLGMMASDSIEELIEQIETIESNSRGAVDLFIESTGGDPLASWRIISLLRSSFKKVNVLVPHSAYSAATLLALGADNIVMGRYGCLGPIDPQITTKKKDGTSQQFGYEDVASFLDFVREEGGITEQQYIKEALDKLCESVEPPVLGFAKRSSALSVSMGEKMLQMHMKDPEKRSQAREIATKLNKSFFSHGHALGRKDAKEIGLNIEEPEKELDDLMWKIHSDSETELNNRIPLDVFVEFFKDPLSAPFLKSVPPITIPPQIANNQQLCMQLLQSHINSQVNATLPEKDIEVKHAIIESTRLASECYSKSRIILQRNIDLQFKVNLVSIESGWRKIPIPSATQTESEVS